MTLDALLKSLCLVLSAGDRKLRWMSSQHCCQWHKDILWGKSCSILCICQSMSFCIFCFGKHHMTFHHGNVRFFRQASMSASVSPIKSWRRESVERCSVDSEIFETSVPFESAKRMFKLLNISAALSTTRPTGSCRIWMLKASRTISKKLQLSGPILMVSRFQHAFVILRNK